MDNNLLFILYSISQEDNVLFTMQKEIGNHWAKVISITYEKDWNETV